MWINKKVKSFTLSEMMVVLVISAIVISLAITVLNLVQQQIRSININYERNAELRLLETTLRNDFNRYNLYYQSRDSVLIGTNPTETVSYKFHQNFILRNTDTLRLQVSKVVSYLDAQEVNDSEIDAVSITFSKEFQHRELFVFKEKDATFYMNSNGL